MPIMLDVLDFLENAAKAFGRHSDYVEYRTKTNVANVQTYPSNHLSKNIEKIK